MAKTKVSAKSQVRPARDPAAPWAANAALRDRLSDGGRSVVYCVTVEGLPLLKIGRTTQLKKRMGALEREVKRDIHIGYWAELETADSRVVEKCALLRMRRQFESEGEWSLADPAAGADAIRSAMQFLGLRPEYDGGAPIDVDEGDIYAELRNNEVSLKQRAVNFVDRDFWKDPFTVN